MKNKRNTAVKTFLAVVLCTVVLLGGFPCLQVRAAGTPMLSIGTNGYILSAEMVIPNVVSDDEFYFSLYDTSGKQVSRMRGYSAKISEADAQYFYGSSSSRGCEIELAQLLGPVTVAGVYTLRASVVIQQNGRQQEIFARQSFAVEILISGTPVIVTDCQVLRDNEPMYDSDMIDMMAIITGEFDGTCMYQITRWISWYDDGVKREEANEYALLSPGDKNTLFSRFALYHPRYEKYRRMDIRSYDETLSGDKITVTVSPPQTIHDGTIESLNQSLSVLTVEVDGQEVPYTLESGVPFVDENNRTQVPLRATMESIGATVSWDQGTQTATVQINGITIQVPIGEKHIIVDGTKIPNDTAAMVKNGRTYLPIRVVLEAAGYSVGWRQETRTVIVDRK